jgi:hypothetical protein
MKNITWDEFEEIEYGEEWEAVTPEEIAFQNRWNTFYERVYKSPNGKFYKIEWNRGSTEYQESTSEPTIVEVEPYEVTVTKYKVKK